ncbi:hypothetical protein [Hymenobacter sediminicola]|uniref:Uncharacterized protein n=1 Tax=Hymenobacter sediminicola TaxID=2761579 RepID=A0A7G7W315_9BACT|nr:hypothetical protein [Hymenobacter sediminicola]QNH60758.1 hypothetical protein H4317_11205 [Hymenobacter sediminicola]
MMRRIYFAAAVLVPTEPVYNDADAAAFLSAAGIGNAAQQQAVHRLAVELKEAGLWAKLHAVYPFVGGTAQAHKLNLKNPADTDAAFRLTFVGAPVHSAGGVQWDGATQYADTHYVPSVQLSGSSGAALGYYSTTNSVAGDVYEMGAYVSASNAFFVCVNNGAFSPARPFYAAFGNQQGANSSDSRGNYVVRRAAGSPAGARLFRNGGEQNPAAATQTDSTGPPACSVTLGVLNVNGGLYGYSNRACAFAHLGPELSDAEIAALHACTQTFQTTLNRAV